MYINLFDSHVHSDNSHDASHSVTYLCETAVDKNLMGISITDHCDINEYNQVPNYELRIRQSIIDTRKAQMVFGPRLLITTGIELGQPLQDMQATERALSLAKYDFIIGSLHNLADEEDFYFMDYNQYDVDDLLRRYFEELYRMAEWGGFDSLAHLTYPLRYIYNVKKVLWDLTPHYDVIDALFKKIIEKGIALELNTSGLRQSIKETLPARPLLERYHSFGGELVTIGSDAHNVDALGSGIQAGMELLAQVGFGFFAFYRLRQPRMIQIF